MQWYNKQTLFILLLSYTLAEQYEEKKELVYLYVQWVLYYLRLVLCFKTLVIYCNSS